MHYIFVIIIVITISEAKRRVEDNEINLECEGKVYSNVSLTAYYPDYYDADHERGYLDMRGKKLRTLQDFIDGRADFVTIAMDEELQITYGTPVCIPELNKYFGQRIKFLIKDDGEELKSRGYSRADVCVRSESDSYDFIVNSVVTLVF